MTNTRKVEIFSAGCPACQETVDLVKRIACPSCDVSVLNMNDDGVSQRAKTLGIHRVPAVVIDGKLADCCSVSAPDEQSLRTAGIGVALVD
jgi:hypothetical protein